MQLLLSSTKILAFNSTKLINITRTPTIHNLWSNMYHFIYKKVTLETNKSVKTNTKFISYEHDEPQINNPIPSQLII